ncbi:MAG: CHAT domain-containing protein [Rhizonema sp. PD38]|nr:CHAT domain-containing protein [Rhizonema sp. PD38]
MNQQSQKTYQNLIDTLINCNSGEEASIFIAYRSLIDFDLPSGFLIAGAFTVVNSLWVVSNSSTAFLMAKFYENLQSQISVAIALNQAQLWLGDITGDELWQWIQEKQLPLDPTKKLHFRKIPANGKPFRDPFHWAAFCVIDQGLTIEANKISEP